MIFLDGSDLGKAAVTCLHYQKTNEDYACKMTTSKVRVNPIGGQSIPYSELNGAKLASRLWLTLLQALAIKEERYQSLVRP